MEMLTEELDSVSFTGFVYYWSTKRKAKSEKQNNPKPNHPTTKNVKFTSSGAV